MKIVIDAKALERLLAGDTELEIELRTNIANQFADKYLKSLVSSKLVSTTGADVEKIVREEILATSVWSKTLTPKYRQAVEEQVALSMTTLIYNTVKEIIDSKHYKTVIEDFVHQEAGRIRNEWTGSNIEERISKAADEKIKKKLGLS